MELLMVKVNINASQLHYGLATGATLTVLYEYVFHSHFDPGFGGWVLGFWLAAIGGDKLNTPNPNGAPNA
jgi:hypothetical protein